MFFFQNHKYKPNSYLVNISLPTYLHKINPIHLLSTQQLGPIVLFGINFLYSTTSLLSSDTDFEGGIQNFMNATLYVETANKLRANKRSN